MKTLRILLALSFVSVAFGLPWETKARDDAWKARHEGFKATNARLGDQIKIVFLGSSLIDYWDNPFGKPIWDANYVPKGAVNYGIAGDKTENVLWRIANGGLDGIHPKLVGLYIGSNNVPEVPNNDDVVKGVNTVVTKIHEKLPNTNILLVGTFPRADKPNMTALLGRIRAIDDKLIALVKNDQTRKGHFLDIFFKLTPITMDKINTQYYDNDKLHFNRAGYELWASEMNPLLN